MNTECGKPWTRKFMMENLTKRFVTHDFKKHQERIFFEIQQARLPETQPIAIIYKNLEEKKMQLRESEKKIRDLVKQLREMRIANYPLMMEINNLEIQYDAMLQGRPIEIVEGRVVEGRAEVEAVNPWLYKCAHNECRGFLSAQWKCGVCDNYTCKKCRNPVISDQQHICNTDDIETVKLLRQDSKPCPKCASLIYKTDGCDQMWCTQCHVAFSWKTGLLEKNIHNPHYFEWMRRQSEDGTIPRQPGDGGGGCNDLNNLIIVVHKSQVRTDAGELIDLGINLDAQLYSPRPQPITGYDVMTFLKQRTLHMMGVDLPRFQQHLDGEQTICRERIKYILNKTSLNEFSKNLQIIHKRIEKSNEITNVLTLFRDSMTDILFRHNRRSLNYPSLIQEVLTLIQYVNECFEDIHNTFGCAHYEIVGDPVSYEVPFIRGERRISFMTLINKKPPPPKKCLVTTAAVSDTTAAVSDTTP